MAYSELIKSFHRIRPYMRSFYVYGFKHRLEHDVKSIRSYDNERRRAESWLGDYLKFEQDAEGKRVFLSVDSRAITENPLYQAFKAKSFTDKDPFTDPQYIKNFRCILSALKEKRKLKITFNGGKGNIHHNVISPKYLEYSEKDDRFRMVGESYRPVIVNLARIEECYLLEETSYISESCEEPKKILILELTDERKTLERFLLHFSHLQKETKRLDDKHYQVTLYYDKNDETELVIRILSFGVWVKVLAPEDFRAKLRSRIEKQVLLVGK